LAIVRSYLATPAKEGRKKEDVGSKETCRVRGSAKRGGESAEVILSIGGEEDGIFWGGGDPVMEGNDFGGESSGGFRGASEFEAIP
jgi:hypothetical protein